MEEIKGFAFDFNGVIGEFKAKNVIKQLNVKDKYNALRILVRLFGKVKQNETLQNLVLQYECGKQTQEEFAKIISVNYPELSSSVIPILNAIPKSCVFNPEMIDFISKVRKMGYKTAIITNNFPENKEVIENSMKDKVDKIIYSSDVGFVKNGPMIFMLSSMKMGLKPEEIVFIDDKASNVNNANTVGFNGIVCKNTTQAIQDASQFIPHEHNLI